MLKRATWTRRFGISTSRLNAMIQPVHLAVAPQWDSLRQIPGFKNA
jgi:nitrate reductase alpha subunit